MTPVEPGELYLGDLRDALERLLAAAERRFGPHIDLRADYYWDIGLPDAFDLASDPRVTTGQLGDDLVELATIRTRSDDDLEMLLWHDLEHVAGLLRGLARLQLANGAPQRSW